MEFTFGAAYYPEHWPRERWETDADRMREMGLDAVRMGEFSWFKMEPEEGRFCFDWLDEAIGLLGERGIRTILGTPTAAPPSWMIAETPEIQPVDSQGRVRHFGGRHHDCQSNARYREHVRRFVTAYARHFADNPNVIGWQVDNELGNSHGDLCYCESCEKRFQEWLRRRYGSIEELNARWGTAFWSQGYQRFEHIQAPKLTVTGHNPSQLLDWKRFCSDLVLEFHDFQAEILRREAPGKFITHNMMGFSSKVSYFELAKRLEFSSQDQYPGGHFRADPNAPVDDRMAAELDFIRGTKGRSFAILEQQASITGWEVLGRAPRPGQLALWSMQCVAHGADAIEYFRWRSCPVGTEQYWQGLLPHSGEPGRNFEELSAFVRKTKPLLRALQDATTVAEVGILFSYEEAYALEIQPQHPEMTYVDHLLTYHRALYRESVPVDFLPYDRDFFGYRVLIAPLYYLTRPEANARLREFVINGGTLVLDMRAGVKDASNRCLTDEPLPVGLSDLVGLEVREYDCLRGVVNTVGWDGEAYDCHKWCDIMHLTTAEPLAAYEDEFYAGAPVITRNAFGNGRCYYVGTEMGDALARRFVQELIAHARLRRLGDAPEGVELASRQKDGVEYLFALNHANGERRVKLDAQWRPYFADTPTGALAPYETRVYTRELR